jgi:hypothetical protein
MRTISRHTTLRRGALGFAVAAALCAIPAAAQNPVPPAAAPRAPAAPMACDSNCPMMHQTRPGAPMGAMGHDMGQMGHDMGPMGGMGQMGGAGMMCPMMGGMGMGGGGMGMHGRGMRHMGMGGMGSPHMQGMGMMGGAPDTAAVRDMAEHHAAMTRAYYDALVRKGFTAEQALRIVSAGAPGAGR